MSRVKCLSMSLLFLLLSMYSTVRAAEYTVPRAAYSLYAEDLDLDGDKDIMVGHKYCSQTDWGGISILENNGYGQFDLADSLFFTNGFAYVDVNYIDNNNYIDVFSQYVSDDPAPTNNRFIGIIYNYGYQHFNNIIYYSLNTRETIHYITTGDIDEDNDIDILVASHNGQFWGVLYNDGIGEFSLPEYHNVDYYPGDVACGDMNNDGRDDIVICGLKLEVYFSYPDSFRYILVDEPHYMCDVEIADMNDDGFKDIVTATWYVPGSTKDISVYLNDGEMNFNDVYVKVVEEAASELFVTDINNDTYPDVLYNVSYSYPNSEYEETHTYILYNNGDNTFADPVNYQTYSGSCEYTASIKSFCIDVDGNGLGDIITVNYSYSGDNSINILFQDGTGNFSEEPQVGIDPQSPHASDVTLSFYPNPFENQTTIEFSIKRKAFIELNIYDIKGRLVKELIKQNMEGGTYNVVWNGKDEHNKQCSSGIYLMNMKFNNVSTKAKKIIIMR